MRSCGPGWPPERQAGPLAWFWSQPDHLDLDSGCLPVRRTMGRRAISTCLTCKRSLVRVQCRPPITDSVLSRGTLQCIPGISRSTALPDRLTATVCSQVACHCRECEGLIGTGERLPVPVIRG